LRCPRIFITSLGSISPIGATVPETLASLVTSACGLGPLSVFTSTLSALLAGEIKLPLPGGVPRTHGLALIAGREAMVRAAGPPDAIVIGVTTGGMPATEVLLKDTCTDPEKYRLHGSGTVARYVAEALSCSGPIMTVSTACSSSLAALKIALELLHSGKARRVLAGGADGLCRLTWYGFNSLQLIDPAGARPFDCCRRGMTVGEGASMLVLEAAAEPPPGALAELLSVGLSCDAWHPAAPHPEGTGALRAMQQALADAGLQPVAIDYINLHGTGTIDNDLAEAKALHALFSAAALPPLSSIKGAAGHTLGAAGALNAVVTVLSIVHGLVPASNGFSLPDTALRLAPVRAPVRKPVSVVLTNAFGFGGNNAAAVFGAPVHGRMPRKEKIGTAMFTVLGSACLSGAGDSLQAMASLAAGKAVCGIVPQEAVMAGLDANAVRRLKRLSRMVLSLAARACGGATPGGIFFGTGWGGLSETSDFLTRLFSTDERFASPTDFIGSVHNAPAGLAAILLKATGTNLTCTDGDYSFEQALFCAGLLAKDSDGPVLVMGADEYHKKLTPLFDSSAAGAAASDGGCGLLLDPSEKAGSIKIRALFLAPAGQAESAVQSLMCALGGAEAISKKHGAIFAGIPAACRPEGDAQLRLFLDAAGCSCPVVDYRKTTGEFASASAVAAALALQCVTTGLLPVALHPAEPSLGGKGILLLGLGRSITAVEVLP